MDLSMILTGNVGLRVKIRNKCCSFKNQSARYFKGKFKQSLEKVKCIIDAVVAKNAYVTCNGI